MKIVALIQARMSSTRLPGKMMMSFRGAPIIEWVIRRVSQSKYLDQVVLATSDQAEDLTLVAEANRLHCNYYTGSLTNVLDRFVDAAKFFSATHIVRICADNPLISGAQIDVLIHEYQKRNVDYIYNHIPKNNLYPDGLGAEMISYDLLCELQKKAYLPRHQEHCFSYILDHPDQFKIKTFDPPEECLQHPELKLDIDTLQDYIKLNRQAFEIDMSDAQVIQVAISANITT